MPERRTNFRRVMLGAACLAVLGFVSPARAQYGTDIVLVIDVSTSMRLMFPEVRERLYQEIDQAHMGDRVVLVTFGEGAHLLARRRVRGPADRAYLRALVQSTEPAHRATYLTRGLDLGFHELAGLFAQAPDRSRRLLWLSDDKNNPPEILGDDVLTLADLRERHDESNPGGEWFAFDAPFGERLSTEVAGFLEWARRSLFYIALQEAEVAFGTVPQSGLATQTTLHFAPQHGALAGLEFLVLARVTDANDRGAAPQEVTVEPDTITVREGAWAQEIALTFQGAPGAYSGYLIFESFAPENFQLDPDRIPLRFTIEAPPLLPTDESELPGRLARSVDADEPEGLVAPGRVGRTDRPVTFGPVAPGKTYTQTITLHANVPLTPEQVRVHTTIDLPDGFTLERDVRPDGDQVRVRFTLRVADEVNMDHVLMTGTAVTGLVRFRGEDANLRIIPPSRNLVVELVSDQTLLARRPRRPASPPPAPVPGARRENLRRLMADTVAPPATRPPATPAPEASRPRRQPPAVPPNVGRWVRESPVTPYVLSVLGGGGALLALAALLRRRPKPTALYGELVVVKDPGRRKLRDMNLQHLGARRGRDALVVGAGPTSDIRLRHPSVHTPHARIFAEAVDGELRIMLDPARGADVRINDNDIGEPYVLRDKDLLALGDFLFLFSAPRRDRRAIVQFIDGSVLEGHPVEWNISEPDFQLLVEREDAPDELAHVEFANLKGVYFLAHRDDGTNPVAPTGNGQSGQELAIEFIDGETLTGYAVNGYTDYAKRFYMVPKDAPTLATVLVERANTKAVIKVQASNGAAPATNGSAWSRLLPWW